MLNTRRLIVATVMGFVTGFICYLLASSGPGELPAAVAYQIILSRVLAGFAIGISIFKVGHWLIHGAVIGIIFSLPIAFSGMMALDNPEYSKSMMFIMTVVLGLIYGILIEFVTTVLFKAVMPTKVKSA
jgi:uncharacterized membrane protein